MVNATCSALHCSSSSRTHRHLKFHHFPNDEKRRRIWLNACKRTDVIDKEWQFFKHKYVCSLHFQQCVYTEKGRLKKHAVPSLNLSIKPLQHDSATHTEKSTHVRPYQNIEEDQYQNNLSILNVMQNLETSSTTTYAQVDVKEESDSFESDIRINTENDDDLHEKSDLETSEEEVEIKPDVGETEVLPVPQSTQSLLSVVTHMKTGELVSFETDIEIKTENDDDIDENSDFKTFDVNVEIKPDKGETEILPVAQTTQSLLSVLTYKKTEELVSFEPDVEIEPKYDLDEKSGLGTFEEDVEIKPDMGETEILSVVQPTKSLLFVVTHIKTEESVSSEPYLEIKKEHDDDIDENNDFKTFEEDVEIKPDIGETEILPVAQSTHSLPSVLTHTKTEELVSFEPDVEIKTENNFENSDFKTFEENVKINPDIGETEILPVAHLRSLYYPH